MIILFCVLFGFLWAASSQMNKSYFTYCKVFGKEMESPVAAIPT